MKNSKNFPFEKARRITTQEVLTARKGIEEKTGKKRGVGYQTIINEILLAKAVA